MAARGRDNMPEILVLQHKNINDKRTYNTLARGTPARCRHAARSAINKLTRPALIQTASVRRARVLSARTALLKNANRILNRSLISIYSFLYRHQQP